MDWSDELYPDDPYVGPEVHTYEPKDGKEGAPCVGGWYNTRGEWVECRSTQRSSVLHDDDDAAFRQRHDHGGGDCMCFEDY